MNAHRSLGSELIRVRLAQGLTVEAAAQRAKVHLEAWEALEAERAGVYALTPHAYAAAARSLGVKWVLVVD